MNRYLIISRLRWPAMLLLTGVIALCHQAGIMSWGHAWPLYLILLGVLALAERAALASDPAAQSTANYPYAGGYQTGYGAQPGQYGAPVTTAPPSVTPVSSTGIVPAHNDQELGTTRADFRNGNEEEER